MKKYYAYGKGFTILRMTKLRIRRGRGRKREKYMKVGWNDDEYSYVERVYVLSIVGTIPQTNQIVYN